MPEIVDRFRAAIARTPPIWAVIGLLALGGVLRFARHGLDPGTRAFGEAYNVAVALAEGRGFADAYLVEQGPTAHLSPVTPLIASAVYRLFGVGGFPAEQILACWAIGLTLATYALLYAAYARLGMPRPWRLTALVILCVTPLYFWQEAVDFRIWDGGLATFLAALFLVRLVTIGSVTAVSVWTTAAIVALLLLVNPLWGVAATLSTAICYVSKLTVPKLIRATAVSALVVVAVVGPWTLRNAIVLNHVVLVRSNAGLELALAMHPDAADAVDQGAVFVARQQAIHPTNNPRVHDAMVRAGGEVPYFNALGRQSWQWMQANPTASLKLGLRHIRQALFPDPWQLTIFGGSAFGGTVRASIISLVALLGMIGLGIAMHERRRLWVYPLILIVVPTLEMSLFQPVQRYTYLYYPILAYAAVFGVYRAVYRTRQAFNAGEL